MKSALAEPKIVLVPELNGALMTPEEFDAVEELNSVLALLENGETWYNNLVSVSWRSKPWPLKVGSRMVPLF